MSLAIHKNLASGNWKKLSLAEQLSNIGSEVNRARKWSGKDENLYQGAILRTLELFDLTLSDSRWKGRLREIGRLRELFCDAITENKFETDLKSLEKYFLHFTFLSQRNKGV